MDADDESRPRRLERQAACLAAHLKTAGTAARGHAAGGTPGPAWRLYIAWLDRPLRHESIARNLFIESPLLHPAVMIRREWLERVGGYRVFAGPEDDDRWLRMWRAGAPLARLPHVRLDWGGHPLQLARTDLPYSPGRLLRLKAEPLADGPLLNVRPAGLPASTAPAIQSAG